MTALGRHLLVEFTGCDSAALADLESLPKRFQKMPADTAVIQQYLRDHVPL